MEISVRLHRPTSTLTAVQQADKDFDDGVGLAFVVPEHTTYPTGLGDEAVSVVKYSEDRPRVETTLRLENLLLTISYEVSGIKWGDTQGYARSTRITQDLARTVVWKLSAALPNRGFHRRAESASGGGRRRLCAGVFAVRCRAGLGTAVVGGPKHRRYPRCASVSVPARHPRNGPLAPATPDTTAMATGRSPHHPQAVQLIPDTPASCRRTPSGSAALRSRPTTPPSPGPGASPASRTARRTTLPGSAAEPGGAPADGTCAEPLQPVRLSRIGFAASERS